MLGRTRKGELCTHCIEGETKAPKGTVSQPRALDSRSLVNQGGGRGVVDIFCAFTIPLLHCNPGKLG